MPVPRPSTHADLFGLVLVGALLGATRLMAGASASPSYSVPHASLDGGGRRSATTHYAVDAGLGGLGVSSGSASGKVRILHGHVGHLNDPPIAVSRHLDVEPGVPRTVTLSAIDVEGDRLSFRVLNPPSQGALSGEAPDLAYTPTLGFVGRDQFTFVAEDPFGTSRPAVVTLDVGGTENTPPVAVGGTVTLLEDGVAGMTLSGSDAEKDPLTFVIESLPAQGTLEGSPPFITYRPVRNYSGLDAFRFRVSDGVAESAAVTVNLLVLPVNDAPTVEVAARVTAAAGAGEVRIPFTVSDPDSALAGIVVTASSGTAALAPDSALTIEGGGVSRELVVRLEAGKAGVARLQLAASDTAGATGRATVELEIPAAMVVLQGRRTAEGLLLQGTLPAGKYFLDASADLRTWFLLAQGEGKAGEMEYVDREVAGVAMRFYRLRLGPDAAVGSRVRGTREDEGYRLRAVVEAGTYRWEASTDLRAWTALSREGVSDGESTYLDPLEPGRPYRFYRLVRE